VIKIRKANLDYYGLLTSSVLIVALVSIPIVYLIIRAVSSEDFFELLFRQRVFFILLRSIFLVISVTLGSTLISFFLAHFLVRTNIPFKKFLTVLCCLPIVIPSYVYGMVFVNILGPKGKFHDLLSSLRITENFPDFYGFWGATIVLTLLSYPYIFLPLRSAMLRMDSSFEDASRSLGRGRFKTFFYVTFPLLSPALRSGGLLVALYTLSDFGAVALLRYETFTWAIMTQFEGAFNRVSASVLSLVLVAIAVLILSSDSFFKGPKSYFSSSSSNRFLKSRNLDYKRWFIFFIICIPPAMGALFPFAGLLYWLFKGILLGESIIIEFGTIFNSLFVAILAAAFTLLISCPITFFATRYKNSISRLIEKISYIGFGLPSIVIAISFVYFTINFVSPIYQTLVMLIIGYGVLFLPVAVSSMKTTLLQLNPNLEDASRGLGLGYWSTMWRVTIPLIMPSILAGALLVFLLTLKELPLTMVLAPLNFDSLSLKVWGFASEAFFAKAALPSIMIILLSGPAAAYLVFKRNELDIRG